MGHDAVCPDHGPRSDPDSLEQTSSPSDPDVLFEDDRFGLVRLKAHWGSFFHSVVRIANADIFSNQAVISDFDLVVRNQNRSRVHPHTFSEGDRAALLGFEEHTSQTAIFAQEDPSGSSDIYAAIELGRHGYRPFHPRAKVREAADAPCGSRERVDPSPRERARSGEDFEQELLPTVHDRGFSPSILLP